MIRILNIPVSVDAPMIEGLLTGTDTEQLRQMQILVEGYVEPLSGPGPHDPIIWVNEEGLLVPMPYNRRASWYACHLWQRQDIGLMGPAFITGPRDGHDDVTSLTDQQIMEIRQFLGE